MDSLNAITNRINLEGLSLKAADALQKLQQAGVFRAIVLQRQGNRILLDTSFGQLEGKAPQSLNRGDEVSAKLVSSGNTPTVRILQHVPRLLTMPVKHLPQQILSGTSMPLLARVEGSDKHVTRLQIGNQTVSIPRQELLQAGERVLLQPHDKNHIRLQRIQPQAILKSALSTLLPREQSNSGTVNMTAMHALSTRMLKPDTNWLANRYAQPATASASSDVKPTTAQTSKPHNAEAPGEQKPIVDSPRATNSSAKTDAITPLLTRLAAPLASLQGLNAQGLQQALVLLSLVKPAASLTHSSAAQTIPDTLQALIQLLKNSPEALKQWVNGAMSQQAEPSSKAANPNRQWIDIGHAIRNDLLQQAEQTFNQLLTQKTTLNLQIEQQQPIQLNLNLPIQVDQEIRELKISISEKRHQQAETEENWEINLAFEFGELGLISTNILLQDKRLSAHFWAQKADTKTLIDTHIEQFKSQLLNGGFELGLFDCFLGQPEPADQPSSGLPVIDNLVDIKA